MASGQSCCLDALSGTGPSARPPTRHGFPLSDSLFLGADVHWLDLADGASLLRTRTGMVDAAPWAARLTLGWRFR
jgi:hypothetical protein